MLDGRPPIGRPSSVSNSWAAGVAAFRWSAGFPGRPARWMKRRSDAGADLAT